MKNIQQVKDITGQKFGHLTALYIDEEKSEKFKRAYWVCECDCGKLKSISGTHLRMGLIVSCGDKIHKIGENSHNWKGGISPERMRARSTIAYSDWRNEVYKKDWYTCQCCGQSKNIEKQAHHLMNFATN